MTATGYSAALRELLDHLYRSARWFGRPAVDHSVLEELTRVGDPSVVPYVVPILFSKSRSDVAAAAVVVDTLLRAATPGDLARLDEAMRRGWYWYASAFDEWRQITPRELARWVGPGEPGTLLLRLSSFHPNGFVREEALRRLGLISDGTELPYLLIRLGDWVEQVRSVACGLVAERARPDYAGHFVDNLELVYRLRQSQRAGGADVLELVSETLAAREARSAMFAVMDTQPSRARRWAFDALSGLRQPDLREFLLHALSNTDPVIRVMTVRRIGEVLSGPELAEALASLDRERSGSVRREILRVAVRSLPDASERLLYEALLDRSAAVREEARYWLKHRGTIDFAQYYRDQIGIAGSAALSSAIMGLGETGGAADAQTLVAYLSHSLASARRASVRATTALDSEGSSDRLLEMLNDPSAGVSAAAAKALRPWAPSIGAEELSRIFRSAPTRHGRRHAIRLMAITGKWDGIGYLLELAGDDDCEVAALASAYVHRWITRYNRSQSVPSAAQLSRIEAALPAASGVSQQDRNQISFAVAGFGKR